MHSRRRTLKPRHTFFPPLEGVPPGAMAAPEETRELADVTIHVRETSPGRFTADFRPTSPETHLARNGFEFDTSAGVRGRTLAEVLEWAENYWRENYPPEPDEPEPTN